MDQEDKTIVRPTLDTIPEDVVLSIVKFVNKWAEVRDIEKDPGRRARNSTLRAVSLASRKAFDLWYPPLIENVTVGLTTLISLYWLLNGDRAEHGKTIKSLRCTQPDREMALDEQTAIDLLRSGGVQITKGLSLEMFQKLFPKAVSRLSEIVISELGNLSTLIIDDPRFIPSNFSSLSSCSLKKIFLALPLEALDSITGFIRGTSARNVIWLLVFCQSLKEVSVAFTISMVDFDYLNGFKSTFKGLSNVTKLALKAHFVSDLRDPKSWWGKAGEKNQKLNRKTRAIYNLLLVTKGLTSLESTQFEQQKHPNDDTLVHSSCLMSLSESFHSLKHLRASHIQTDPQDPYSTNYNVFRSLKILSVDRLSLTYLLEHETAELPSSIKVIYLSCYLTGLSPQHRIGEERYLAHYLKSRSISSLREVVVPTELIGLDGQPGGDAEERVLWAERRKDLEDLEIFKGGKVKLIKEKPGPFMRIDAEDEVCLSTFQWRSPWH